MVENFAAMMAGSLGLTEPWHIKSAAFDAEEMAVRIRKAAGIACPVCGSSTKRFGYDKNIFIFENYNINGVRPYFA